ncbi:hypothetical protein ACOSQ3_002864 [Xanthoceras sorbifolium]
MDTDAFSKLCARMKLSEEEGKTVNIDGVVKEDGLRKISLCLVGKLVTSKLTNREAFRSLIAKIWRTTQAVEVENVKENVYAFHFQNMMDRRRVLLGGPWNFDNALLVLEVPTGYGDFSEMKFRWAEFWVQVHNVPLVCMTRNVGLFLGKHIGQVKEIDVGASGDCLGKFLRIRVAIDILKPLKRVLRVKLEGMMEEKTLLLKYERLLEYCFCCGLLGHRFRECPGEEEGLEPRATDEFGFGSWLRASSPGKTRPAGTQTTRPGSTAGNPGQERQAEPIVPPEPEKRKPPRKELVAPVPEISESRSVDCMALNRRDFRIQDTDKGSSKATITESQPLTTGNLDIKRIMPDFEGNHQKGKETEAGNQYQTGNLRFGTGENMRVSDEYIVEWTGPHDAGGLVLSPDLGLAEEKQDISVGLQLPKEQPKSVSKEVDVN